MLIYLVHGLIPLITTLTRNVVSHQNDEEKKDTIKNLRVATTVRIMNVVKQYDHNFLYNYRNSLLIIMSAF